MREVRCSDGSLVHDFKGQRVCPGCGFTGIVIPERHADDGTDWLEWATPVAFAAITVALVVTLVTLAGS